MSYLLTTNINKLLSFDTLYLDESILVSIRASFLSQYTIGSGSPRGGSHLNSTVSPSYVVSSIGSD